MAKKIVILEDNAERRAAMQVCLQDRFHQFEIVFLSDACAMQRCCEADLDDAIVIALDHDLELVPGPDGRCFDPGTGRDVANYLAGKKPVCPVVIHSTNSSAAVGMEMVLQQGGWKTYRVIPGDDLDWIATAWFRTLRRAIVDNASPRKPSGAR